MIDHFYLTKKNFIQSSAELHRVSFVYLHTHDRQELHHVSPMSQSSNVRVIVHRERNAKESEHFVTVSKNYLKLYGNEMRYILYGYFQTV